MCKNYLSLLLQLHGDLPEHFPHHERRLFLFGCRRKECQRESGSIRVFRSVRSFTSLSHRTANVADASDPNSESKVRGTSSLGDAIFGVNSISRGIHNANPFTIIQEPSKGEAAPHDLLKPKSGIQGEWPSMPCGPEPCKISVNDAHLDTTIIQQVQDYSICPSAKNKAPLGSRNAARERIPTYKPFPLYYLEAEHETLDKPTITSPGLSIVDIESSLPPSNERSLTKDDPAAYESALDKTFQRFADRLAQNPLQVIRYEFRGSPLLYSKKDEVGRRLCGFGTLNESATFGSGATNARSHINIPVCENCGSRRVFEVQVTPYAISLLEENEVGEESMEWGTIIVGVCGKDCTEKGTDRDAGYVEEWVGVQWEEM